jgi:phosphomannomutase
MKKLVVFDLDGTLAESKASLDAEMAILLGSLFEIVKVAVISGGDWPQFEKQVLSNLPHDERLKNLSLLPTCGTKYFQYSGEWKKIYSEDFTADEKKKITSSLKDALGASASRPKNTGAKQLKTAEARLRSRHWDNKLPSKKRKNGTLISRSEKR